MQEKQKKKYESMDIRKKSPNHRQFLSVTILIAIMILTCLTPPSAQAIFKQESAGDNRYQTSIKISQEGWQTSDYVILANDRDYADAFCAGPLAQKHSAPLLLTEPQGISFEVLEELQRLKAKYVLIVGGPKAIAETAETQLQRIGIQKIERIYGGDRYETSVRIAEKLKDSRSVALVSGLSPWDALTFHSIATQKGTPILFVAQDDLPAVVREYFEKNIIMKTYLIGGENVIGPKIQKRLSQSLRLGGRNRYGTNILILKEFEKDFNFDKIYLLSGGSTKDGFADALGPAILAGMTGSPFILFGENYSEGAKETLEYLKSQINFGSKIIVVGGEDAFSAVILRELNNYFHEKNKKSKEENNVSDRDDSSIRIPVCSVTGVSAPSAKVYYKAGDTIEITITFNGKVRVTGVPLLGLQIGEIEGDAVYLGGDDTAALTFVYTVQPGDNGTHLDYTGVDALKLNGGNITVKGYSSAAKLILPLPGEVGSLSLSQEIIIDTRAPSAIKISAQNIIVGKGSVILTAVDGPLSDESWEDILQVLKANTEAGLYWIKGINAVDLNLVPEADGVTAVLSNSNSARAEITADLVFPAAKVVDRAGNKAVEDITVDSYFPRMITEVSILHDDRYYHQGNYYYKEGQEIPLTVNFDRDVEVEGTPTLKLGLGTGNSLAYYTEGSGSTQLIFTYQVQPRDTSEDLDYLGTDALQLNEGTIKVRDTQIDANLTLPAPGETGSLSQKNIIIDTTAPTAVLIAAQEIIPAKGGITLTAVDGPLSDASWIDILNCIKGKITNGEWIAGISKTDLTISIADDGVRATLNNTSNNKAYINADFLIPAGKVVDRAGNVALEDIIIDAQK
jgi:putative cell wall-binding protein